MMGLPSYLNVSWVGARHAVPLRDQHELPLPIFLRWFLFPPRQGRPVGRPYEKTKIYRADLETAFTEKYPISNLVIIFNFYSFQQTLRGRLNLAQEEIRF